MFLKFRGAKPLLAKSLPMGILKGETGFQGGKSPFPHLPSVTGKGLRTLWKIGDYITENGCHVWEKFVAAYRKVTRIVKDYHNVVKDYGVVMFVCGKGSSILRH